MIVSDGISRIKPEDLIDTRASFTRGKPSWAKNYDTPHTLAVGTLVQVEREGSEQDGLRLFVAKQTRSNGSGSVFGLPTYALSMFDPCKEDGMFAWGNDSSSSASVLGKRFLLSDGFFDGDLKVIRTP